MPRLSTSKRALIAMVALVAILAGSLVRPVSVRAVGDRQTSTAAPDTLMQVLGPE